MNTVEEYISSFEGETRGRLETLDAYIRSLDDGITTKISWAMPSYMLKNKYVAQICVFKNHIGFYPGPDAVEAFKENFDRENLKHTKGGVQLPHDRPLPLSLIGLIALSNCQRYSAKKEG
jgi:uncharacterized protein YdhG (YjbR/CyaY superfamily)